MFYFDTIDNKKILKSTLLEGTEHFFTTREFPLSCGALNELEEICTQNREITANYLDLNTKCLISPVQTHTANISIAQRNKPSYEDTDALVLSNKNLGIFLNFADCVPLIIWDSEKNIGAIAHAGWKGTAQSIACKTVKFLEDYYESRPSDLIVAIGPAISMKNYHVDEDVFRKLMITLPDEPSDCWKFDKENKKYNVDLKRINYHQLLLSGVDKIDLCSYCTYDTNDIFFSYRKENGVTARHSAVLKLKP